MTTTPVHVDMHADYQTLWMIEPPAEGVPHRITKQAWNDDYTVRYVWEWVAA